MSLSAEMKLLYQTLDSDILKAFPEEKEFMEASLKNKAIRENLELRLRLVELVGIIKFINDLPIFVPEVEKVILEGIKAQAIKNNLNPNLTTSFLKVVMDHSKAVQARLIELLKEKPSQAPQLLSEKIALLKADIRGNSDTLAMLEDKAVPAQKKLGHCRTFVQGATEGVLKEMVGISLGIKLNKRLSFLSHGLRTEGIYEAKTNGRTNNNLFRPAPTGSTETPHAVPAATAASTKFTSIPSRL